MIAHLSGKVSDTYNQTVVLDVGGVGYGVLLAAEDYTTMTIGEQRTLYVYEHIQEKAHDLFGFTSRQAKQFFETLLGVNGVGPKMALALLDLGTVTQIQQAIASENIKFLTGASGVGKRLAERVVVDLRDKMNELVMLQGAGVSTDSAPADDEALSALIGLGFSQQQAVEMLQAAEGDTTEERVANALRNKE